MKNDAFKKAMDVYEEVTSSDAYKRAMEEERLKREQNPLLYEFYDELVKVIWEIVEKSDDGMMSIEASDEVLGNPNLKYVKVKKNTPLN
ncbi:hypothetical protein [Thomasclavelia cocleata]|jgi:hypothetical protein|uniref:hypothetical protein n=1 Tax=Thomasclavelia cocleata TaxID=69824 RepID=UPI00241DA4AF|nr:hypothetical protein [Thomasclavelia cocleata]